MFTRIVVERGGYISVVERLVQCDSLRLRNDNFVIVADEDQCSAVHHVDLVQR